MHGTWEEYTDYLCTILCMCLAISNISYLARYWNKNLVSTRTEKTIVSTDDVVLLADIDLNSESYESTFGNTFENGADLILGLLVADDCTPYPNAVKVNNSGLITIGSDWTGSKYSAIASVKSDGTSLLNMTDWKVKNVTLEYGADGSYWHFILADT